MKAFSKILVFSMIAAFMVGSSLIYSMAVADTPVPAETFYGTLTINGNPGPAGTHIMGKVGGVDKTDGTYVTAIAGQYGSDGFEGKFGVNCQSGDMITFSIEKSPGSGQFFDVPSPFECNPGAQNVNLDIAISFSETCQNGATMQCGQSNVGECKFGTQTCSGGAWGSCVGAVNPVTETCNGKDDDCNGVIDNGFNVGQSCSAGVGACQAQGTYVCSQNGLSTVCNAVPGTPTAEICGNQIDDNCNGQVDETCACSNGATQACGSGPCAGTQTCSAGAWGACSSSGSDCGICGSCSSAGACSYNSSQNGDCSGNSIAGIATCTNNPDANPFTWDFRAAFSSQCTGLGTCSTGSSTITHACSKSSCGATCETDADCNDNNVNTVDSCLANCSCSIIKSYCLEIASLKVLNATFFQDSTIPAGTMYNVEMKTFNGCGNAVASMQIVQILKGAEPVNLGTVISTIQPGDTSVITVGFMMPFGTPSATQFTAKAFNWNHWIDQNPATFQILSATSQAGFQTE